MSLKSLWNKIRQSPNLQPTRLAIPADHTDRREQMSEPFSDNQHYFTVRVNEMFLSYKREWYSTYAPMVMVVSEFLYDKKKVIVPYVVGPSMMEKHITRMPEGMVFTNTRVAGIHPYKGDKLALSVVLNRVRETDYARKLLDLIENTSNTLDFSTALTSYIKVGRAVLAGVESLFDLGDTDPIVGHRTEFDPNSGDVLQPGYHVLINSPESEVEAGKLWVKDNALYYGDSLQSAQPFRQEDYVLYSINQTQRRNDEETLSFHDAWQEILDHIGKMTSNKEDDWKFIGGKLFGLYHALMSSPDLTREQARALFQDYKNRVDQAKQDLAMLGGKGGEKAAVEEEGEEAELKRESLDLLNL